MMSNLPTYRCRRISGPLEPSAHFDRPPWDASEWIEDFEGVGQQQGPLSAHRFLRAACHWDREYLCVAFVSAPSLVPVTKTARDDDLFNECAVELFLAAGQGFYEFEINPLGAVLDLYCPHEDQEADWRPQARWDAAELKWAVEAPSADASWSAEMRLPWAAIPLVNREEFDGYPCLRGNFCRSGKRPAGSYEPASWTRVNGRYSELKAMGYILLTE